MPSPTHPDVVVKEEEVAALGGMAGLLWFVEMPLDLSPSFLDFSASLRLFRKASKRSTRSLHCISIFLRDSCSALSVSFFGR